MSGALTVNGTAPNVGAVPRRQYEHRANKLARNWSSAMDIAGLAREFTTASGSSGIDSPRVAHIDLGEFPYLMVRIPSGRLLADFEEAHDRIATALGCTRLQFVRRGQSFLKVYLDPPDPLTEQVSAPQGVDSGLWPVEFGRLENGQRLTESLFDAGHLAAQGQTRSGKSRWVMSVLSQLTTASHLEIAGIDPTAKLLGPWHDHPSGSHIAATSDYAEIERVTKQLVQEMRERIAAIPRNQDKLTPSREYPLRLVVLEEWANVLTLASIAKNKAKGLDTEVGKHVQMLLAESHKAGYRILMLSQRMDGSLVGGFNRDNFSHRFSFRTASREGLKMLHEGVGDLVALRHRIERPAVSLVETPEQPLQRMRAHEMPSYEQYLKSVDTGSSLLKREALTAAA